MSDANREWILTVKADIADAKTKLETLQTTVDQSKDHVNKLGELFKKVVTTAAVVAFTKTIVDAASQSEQAIGGVKAVFGDYAGEIEKFSDSTAKSLGLSKTDFNNLAVSTGALLKNAGIPLDKVADSTETLTKRAADMAATFGGSVSDAMDAINSGLKGSGGPLEKYGVILTASAVNAEAIAAGLTDSEGKASDFGKATVRLSKIMDQSSDAQGQFAKESDTVAGQAARLKAEFADLEAELGKNLLPVMVKVLGALKSMVEFVANNQGWLVPLAASIVAIVAAVKLWEIGLIAWKAITLIATGVQAAFNIVMDANPVVLVVVAIAALVAGFILLYNNVDWFRELIDKVGRFFKEVFEGMVTVFEAVIVSIGKVVGTVVEVITYPYRTAYNQVKDVIDKIPAIFDAILAFIKPIVFKVIEVITYPYRTAYDAIKTVIDKVPAIFSATVTAISSALSTVWQIVSYPFTNGVAIALTAWEKITTFASGLYGKIQTSLAGVAELILYPFKMAFNLIAKGWNNTVGGFGFTIPSWVPGVGGKSFKIPNIPELAKGGIVTRATLAVLGEAGPEAVVPLDKAGLAGNVVINVYALTANAEVGKQVFNALKEYERISGKSFAA